MQGLLFEDGELEPRTSTTTKPLYRDLLGLYEQSRECTKCRLASTRTRFVFGEGNPQARLVVIGEAPGADEDAQGRPFVGRSGQLLDKILLAVGFRREEVFICNILKCRPPQNRNPLQDEIKNLNSFRALERGVAYEISRQIQLIEAGGAVAQETVGWTSRCHGHLQLAFVGLESRLP